MTPRPSARTAPDLDAVDRPRAISGYSNGRARRAEIVDRATAMFARSGFRGVSMREIAAGCGLSHPGLLHHFPSKEAVLIAVLERRDKEDEEAVSASGGLEQLEQAIRLARRNEQRRGIIELFVVLSAESIAVDHPAHEYFASRYERVVASTASAFRAVQQAGALRAGVEPAHAAREMVALMDGLQLQWLLGGRAGALHDTLQSWLQNLLTVPLGRTT